MKTTLVQLFLETSLLWKYFSASKE